MKGEPYSGYTWPFAQHAVALTPKNLLGLLSAARIFQGRTPRPSSINKFLVESEILTSNIRSDSGQVETWRDYQQVLPELGLMSSLKMTSTIQITPMGLALIDGMLGYSEVLTTQALRYQYPNGFKNDISPSLRKALRGSKSSGAKSLMDLQMSTSVMIKPANVLLDTLVQLFELGEAPTVSIAECRMFLLSCSHYSIPVPIDSILNFRISGKAQTALGEKRNVQDWFKLLSSTDLFEFVGQSRNTLTLSAIAKKNLTRVKRLVDFHKDPDSFWVPSGVSKGERLNWFRHYGSFGLADQWYLYSQEFTSTYENANYPLGRESEDEASVLDQPYKKIAGLRDVSLTTKAATKSSKVPTPQSKVTYPYVDTEKKRALHQLIVSELAAIFRAKGAKVSEDPRSVDLLVSLDGREGIVEVKTVTARNFIPRVRSAVGQLYEYQYRRVKETGNLPEMGLALSTDLPTENWVREYLKKHLRIGFVGKTSKGYNFYPAKGKSLLDVVNKV